VEPTCQRCSPCTGARLSTPSSHLAAVPWANTHAASSRHRACGDKDSRPGWDGPTTPCLKRLHRRPQLIVPHLNSSRSAIAAITKPPTAAVVSFVGSHEPPQAERRRRTATGHASCLLLPLRPPEQLHHHLASCLCWQHATR
jgi:hypothetical protein